MNRGFFHMNNYCKYVDFSKAVLWMTKEISISPEMWEECKTRGVNKVVFVDEKKSERWYAPFVDLYDKAKRKKVGQEEQYYIPIDAFTRESYSTVKGGVVGTPVVQQTDAQTETQQEPPNLFGSVQA